MVVEIGRRRSQKDETLEVSFDGDTAARLVVGGKFSIRKASDTTRILKLSNKMLSRDPKQKDAGIHISGKRRAE